MTKNIQNILSEFTKETKVIFGDALIKIILYGSYARNDYHENSDIDIMILTTLSNTEIEKKELEVFDLAFEFQIQHFVDISVIVKNWEQFQYWLGILPFYDNIQREGIVLHG